MITKEELKERYDGKTIDELQDIARKSQTGLREAQVEMVMVLYYLKTTHRYKENRRYAKASWKTYIEEMMGIREGTFGEWARAIINYPEEVKRHHIGLVSKVVRQCGPVKAQRAFTEINKVVDTAKKDGPAVAEKIEKVIDANRAKPRVKREVTDWKAMYEREAAAHEATKGKLKEALAVVKDLTDQVEKLKKTAETFVKVRDIFEHHYDKNSVQAAAN